MKDVNIPLESILDASRGSIFKLAILAAKRAMELADGQKPMIEKPGEKVLDNALREMAAGKVSAKNGKK